MNLEEIISYLKKPKIGYNLLKLVDYTGFPLNNIEKPVLPALIATIGEVTKYLVKDGVYLIIVESNKKQSIIIPLGKVYTYFENTELKFPKRYRKSYSIEETDKIRYILNEFRIDSKVILGMIQTIIHTSNILMGNSGIQNIEIHIFTYSKYQYLIKSESGVLKIGVKKLYKKNPLFPLIERIDYLQDAYFQSFKNIENH